LWVCASWVVARFRLLGLLSALTVSLEPQIHLQIFLIFSQILRNLGQLSSWFLWVHWCLELEESTRWWTALRFVVECEGRSDLCGEELHLLGSR
jgi:hypothetical protein